MKNINKINLKKKIALWALMLISSTHVFAHALFIKTEAVGKKNKTHEITVFYAEPSNPKKELIKDWWSNTKDFTLWLTKPNGKKEKLDIVMKENYFTANFIPLTNGIYSLIIQHAAKDIAGDTQYEFNTSSLVVVGKNYENDMEATGLIMFKKDADKPKRNKETFVQLLNDNQPLADTKITIFSAKGWEKTIKTDANGIAFFIPEWKGTYLLEASKIEKITDKDYQKKYRIMTTIIDCK